MAKSIFIRELVKIKNGNIKLCHLAEISSIQNTKLQLFIAETRKLKVAAAIFRIPALIFFRCSTLL